MMRLHFISRLALMIAGSFLVVATQEGVWTANSTLKWMFVIGGALAILVAAADATHDAIEQRALDFLTAVVGAWMVVEAFTLTRSDLPWWAFGSAAAIAGLSTLGLMIHESSTERVVHELRVTHHEDARRQAEMPNRITA